MPAATGQARIYSEVCYVVRDLEATVDKWVRTFGAGPFFTIGSEVMLDRRYRGRPAEDSFVAAIGFLGTTVIEFIQPRNDAPSIFREILDTRGEAVHHVLPQVRACTPAQYDTDFERYRAQGFEPAMTLVVPGFGRNAFFDAVDSLGFFIELLEIPPETAHMTDDMHAAHLAWDGRDPIRSLL